MIDRKWLDGPPPTREEFVLLLERVGALEQQLAEPQPDSDGWIPHDGGECPVPYDMKVEVWLRDNEPAMGPKIDWAKHFIWRHQDRCYKYDIIAYRPAKQETEWPKRLPGRSGASWTTCAKASR